MLGYLTTRTVEINRNWHSLREQQEKNYRFTSAAAVLFFRKCVSQVTQ